MSSRTMHSGKLKIRDIFGLPMPYELSLALRLFSLFGVLGHLDTVLLFARRDLVYIYDWDTRSSILI